MFDVLIVGGGPAGAATALALERRGCRTALVESTRYDRPRLGDTLAPEARGPLRRLGVEALAEGEGRRAYHSIRAAWGKAEAEETSLLFRPWGTGVHVDRNRFDAALAGAAAEAGTEVLTGSRVTAVEAADDGWSASVAGDAAVRSLRARWLVDASGRCPALAPRVGRRFLAEDRLVGMARYVETPQDGENGGHLLIEATETGWWSSAPLADGRLSVVLMTDADLVQGQPGGAAGFWQRQLAATDLTRRRLGGDAARVDSPVAAAPVTVRPARSGRLDEILAPRFVAVGDAACAFDPLSGYGVAKALEDALAAADGLAAALEGDFSPLTAQAAGVASSYRDYLAARAAYYLREPRWPAAPFWVRRRRLDPHRVPVLLDPHRRLVFRDTPATRRQLAELAPLLPAVPLVELAELARRPISAHRLAAAFLARTGDGGAPAHGVENETGAATERAVVVALQLLTQRRILA